MNYNFFADRRDKIQILEFIFGETDFRVYDSYSPPGQMVAEYSTSGEVDSKFSLENGETLLTFQIWSPRFLGAIEVERVALDPEYCEGHTFRYRTTGWGLIQLYFGLLNQNRLEYSHIGHNSRKRAVAWQDTYPEIKRPDDWDWKEIEKASRKLKYFIHNKCAHGRIASLGVMPGAYELAGKGTEMSYFAAPMVPRDEWIKK